MFTDFLLTVRTVCTPRVTLGVLSYSRSGLSWLWGLFPPLNGRLLWLLWLLWLCGSCGSVEADALWKLGLYGSWGAVGATARGRSSDVQFLHLV